MDIVVLVISMDIVDIHGYRDINGYCENPPNHWRLCKTASPIDKLTEENLRCQLDEGGSRTR